MGIVSRANLTFTRAQGPPLPADSPELQALAGHLRAGRCALFVGAGLSAPAGLPTWGALLDRMVNEATPWAVDPSLIPGEIVMVEPTRLAMREPPLSKVRKALGPAAFDALCERIAGWRDGRVDLQVLDQALSVISQDSDDRAELQRLVRDKRFAEVAGKCRDRLGRERFHQFIRTTLAAPRVLPASHRDIVRTPYSCIVTTNFDGLIEEAFARYGTAGLPRAPAGGELGAEGTLLLDRGFFVLKAHGDAARPDTMVFTADDYRRVIHANPAFQTVLGGILLTHAVLFVGYSLSDTNFRLLLDNQLTIFNGNVPPRYAVLSGVGPVERDILWKTARLQVLPYPEGQHSEVARCLAVLARGSLTSDPSSMARSNPPRPTPSRTPRPFTSLHVDSDGERVVFELVRHRARGPDAQPRVGGAPYPDTRAMGRWLRRADGAQGRGESPLPEVRRVGARLAASLEASLGIEIARVPRTETIEIACSAAATRIPWEWLEVGGRPLALRNPLVRRPVEVTHEARGLRSVSEPLKALVFGDAGTGDGKAWAPLRHADLEAKAIESLLRAGVPRARVTRLAGRTATHARVIDELSQGDYDVIHFGGHAWFDDREALFLLWDRVMLGSELAPLLRRRPPALMVLDTHYTAFVLAEADTQARELVGAPSASYVLPPLGPPRGFAEAAMRGGVTSFVGTFGNIADEAGANVAVAFFAYLLTGRSVAEALLAARLHTARLTHDAGLMYTVYGCPGSRLVEPVGQARGRGAVTKAIARAKAKAEWD